jgi:hypothetical protein
VQASSCLSHRFLLVVEAKTEAIAEGRKRSLDGIGFGRLEGQIMGLT